MIDIVEKPAIWGCSEQEDTLGVDILTHNSKKITQTKTERLLIQSLLYQGTQSLSLNFG